MTTKAPKRIATYQVTLTVYEDDTRRMLGKIPAATNDDVASVCAAAVTDLYGHSRAGNYVKVNARSQRVDE